ncbi:hypothetical protein Trydic_g20486 [Trypoxylus dichotomus]
MTTKVGPTRSCRTAKPHDSRPQPRTLPRCTARSKPGVRDPRSADERSKQTGYRQDPAVQGYAETNADLRSGNVGDPCKEPRRQTLNIPEPDATTGSQRALVHPEHHHTPGRRNSTPNGLHPDHRKATNHENPLVSTSQENDPIIPRRYTRPSSLIMDNQD